MEDTIDRVDDFVDETKDRVTELIDRGVELSGAAKKEIVKSLLEKSGGLYSLTPTSETYLVRGGRGYCVPIYLAWLQAREKFIDFVRTGKSTLDLTSSDAEDLWVSYAAPDRVRLPELLELVTKRWNESGIPSRLKPGAHILDLGSGSGFKSFSLLQLAAASLSGCLR